MTRFRSYNQRKKKLSALLPARDPRPPAQPVPGVPAALRGPLGLPRPQGRRAEAHGEGGGSQTPRDSSADRRERGEELRNDLSVSPAGCVRFPNIVYLLMLRFFFHISFSECVLCARIHCHTLAFDHQYSVFFLILLPLSVLHFFVVSHTVLIWLRLLW